MTNNPITDAALAELDRLHAAAPPTPYYYGHDPNDQDRWNNEMWSNAEPNPSFFLVNVDHPKSGEVMAFVATLCNAYPALRQRLLDAESRLAEAERERDQLRALADTARDGMRQLGEDLEASRAEVERLRGEFSFAQKRALEWATDNDSLRSRAEAAESLVAGLRGALEEVAEYEGESIDKHTAKLIKAALAITPASAGNRIKAEAYREAARLVDSCSAETLHREADRLASQAEKEAANATSNT